MSISVLDPHASFNFYLGRFSGVSDEAMNVYNKLSTHLSTKENVSIYERYFMYRLVNAYWNTNHNNSASLLELNKPTQNGNEFDTWEGKGLIPFLLYIQNSDDFCLHTLLTNKDSEYLLFCETFKEDAYFYLDTSYEENLFPLYDFELEESQDNLQIHQRKAFFRECYNQLKSVKILPKANFNLISDNTFSFYPKALLEALPCPIHEVSFSNLVTTSAFKNKLTLYTKESDCILSDFHLSAEAQLELPRRLPGISVSSFSSGTNQSTFTLKSLTQKQANHSGSFSFFCVRFKNLNADFPEELSLILLVSFKNSHSLTKYSKARRNITKLNNYLSNNALYFVNNEAYQAYYKEKFKKLSVYSSNWAEYLSANNHITEDIVSSLEIKSNVKDSFDSLSSNAFFSSFNIQEESNELIKSKQNFAKLLKNQAEILRKQNDSIKYSVINFKELVTNKISILHSELQYIQNFSAFKDCYAKYPKLTSQAREANEMFISNIAKNYISLVSQRKNYLDNIDYTNAELNETNLFTNLNNTYGIEIYSITYEVDSEEIIIEADSEAVGPSAAISLMLVAKQINPTFRFKTIKFATKDPVKILPNGNESRAIVAGPYVIEVSQRNKGNAVSLNLSLKDNASIFGIHGNTYYAHPHAGGGHYDIKNIADRIFSACLGESSSYIFKAFAKNDLISIIVNIFVWLRSANTADTWGKNYKYFPKWSDLVINQQEEDSIDLKDVIAKSIISEETSSDSSNNQHLQDIEENNPGVLIFDNPQIYQESPATSTEDILETTSNSEAISPVVEQPVYIPQEPVFLQEQPTVRPPEITLSESIAISNAVYTPYVRT